MVNPPQPETRDHDWVGLILILAMVGAVVAGMHRLSAVDRFMVLFPLAIGGAILGYFLARWLVADFLAHSIALWLGLIATMFAAVTERTTWAAVRSSWGEEYFTRTKALVQEIFSRSGDSVSHGEIVVALGMVAWLVAYCAAWIYFRYGWFWMSVLGPAVVLITALKLDNNDGTVEIAIFLFAAICLGARNSSKRFQRGWRVRQIPVSQELGRSILGASASIAAIAVALSLILTSLSHGAIDPGSLNWLHPNADSLKSSVTDHLPSQGGTGSSYADFTSSFKMGGHLDRDNAVVATVASQSGHYLAVARYDNYQSDGSWSIDASSTFQLPGQSDDVSVTKVIFRSGQTVALSPDVTGERQSESAKITLVQNFNDLVPTIETFASSDQQTYALMGWQQVDLTYDVNHVQLATVPVDLQELVRSVRGAEFSVDPDTGDVTLTNPETAQRFAIAQDQLKAYPISASLTSGDDGALLIDITGRIPNYDDIQALYTKADLTQTGSYQTLGLGSTATAAELENAGTTYPDWVTSRYLQLPDGVSQRTRDLASQIVANAGSTNPFSSAQAIQDYLRASYGYEENSPLQADGQDYVDYFLFDHQAGRCEQFSTAMTVMLRSLGIPARVVTGFSDSPGDAAGQYVYRNNQSHQWVEVFFPGLGWVPFEPTPSQAALDYGSGSSESQADGQSKATPLPELSITEPAIESTPELQLSPVASPVPQSLDTGDSSGSGSRISPALLAILFLLIVSSLIAFFALQWRWKSRGFRPAAALMFRLQRVGGWASIRAVPNQTPLEYAETIGRRFPDTLSAARSIAAAYTAEQYGGEPIDPESAGRASRSWSTIRSSILRHPMKWLHNRRGI